MNRTYRSKLTPDQAYTFLNMSWFNRLRESGRTPEYCPEAPLRGNGMPGLHHDVAVASDEVQCTLCHHHRYVEYGR